jgi:short-subunit dehydrogenase
MVIPFFVVTTNVLGVALLYMEVNFIMEYVLITGASSGIGYELAKVYAEHGANLILVATKEERLNEVKEEIIRNYPVQVVVIVKDLSKLGAAKELYQETVMKNLRVTELINNAGIGFVGEFDKISYQQEEDMMILNMVSLLALTKLFLLDMKREKSGRILNVASNGAFQPGPYVASYYATKAFVLNFTEAIRMENAGAKIHIATLCPGATRTNFPSRAGREQAANAMSPELVARIAYKQFHKNKSVIIPGIANRFALLVPKKLRSKFILGYQKKLAK